MKNDLHRPRTDRRDTPHGLVEAATGSADHALEASWLPPEPSRACRTIPLRSTASYRGSIVDAETQREYVFESLLEQAFIHVALVSPDVVEVHEQPPAVSYVDHHGKTVDHFFDVWLRMRNGTRVAVDVKPRDKIEKSGIRGAHRLIEAQVGRRFADVFLVRTEDHVHPDDAFDARLILRARRLADPAADAAVAKAAPFLAGWCRLADLVEATGGGSAAFNAAVRAIGAGLLETRRDLRISFDAFVRRAVA